MKRLVLALVAGLAVMSGWAIVTAQGSSGVMTVQRDPGCGCCMNWVAHLQRAGFKVSVTESQEMQAIKNKLGVPQGARSCHTGVINGYVIEGHVPADDVKRLLKARPAGVIGIATPGMPVGSPGMEVAGRKADPYDVLAFDKTGKTKVFASYR